MTVITFHLNFPPPHWHGAEDTIAYLARRNRLGLGSFGARHEVEVESIVDRLVNVVFVVSAPSEPATFVAQGSALKRESHRLSS